MSNFRTPLSQARGLGAAKHGAVEWLLSGMAVLALVPLCLWAAYGVLRLASLDYYGAVAWIGQPRSGGSEVGYETRAVAARSRSVESRVRYITFAVATPSLEPRSFTRSTAPAGPGGSGFGIA